jgi:hypothetical protein
VWNLQEFGCGGGNFANAVGVLMERPLNQIHKILKCKGTILLSYIVLKAYQLGYSIVYSLESSRIILVRTVGLVVFSILAILTYKNIKVARWLMGLNLLIIGLANLVLGIFGISISQYVLKPFTIIIGAYFMYGGWILLSPQKQSIGSEENYAV